MLFLDNGKAYLQTEKGFVGVEIHSDKILPVGGRRKKKLSNSAVGCSARSLRLKFGVTEDNPLLFGDKKADE